MQKDKSILSIFSETIRGSQNVREELKRLSEGNYLDREPKLSHQVRHGRYGKWWD